MEMDHKNLTIKGLKNKVEDLQEMYEDRIEEYSIEKFKWWNLKHKTWK